MEIKPSTIGLLIGHSFMEFILFVFYEQLKNYVLKIFANYDFSNIHFKVAVGIIVL